LNVLLEPEAVLEDSLTYDLTAWALPYAYGLEAFALKEKILPAQKIEAKQYKALAESNSPTLSAFAYTVMWQDFENVRFLTKALKAGIKIRQAINSFEVNGSFYPAGTLVILRSDNKILKDFDQKLFEVAKQTQQFVSPLPTGAVDKGNDLGSEYYIPLKNLKIGIVGGDGTDATEFGAVWHHFERDLEYPVTVVQHEILSNINLQKYKYDVLILPTGRYQAHSETLMEYAKQGGKIIALDNAMNFTAYKGTTSIMGQRLLKAQEERTDAEQNAKNLERFEYRERSFLTESTAGAVCKIKLDNTHPLAYGLGKTYYSLRLNQKHYALLPKGHWNVGVYDEKPLVSGFIGKVMLGKIPNTFAFGVENIGRGNIIYLPETPVFRGFWYNGKMLFANAVFAVK
jgi:hypothetical protein